MKLIVGLGNPGRKYQATRHNAGFWWVDEIVRVAGTSFRHETGFHGEVARVPRSELWLLKPQTYMNESGRAVGAFSAFYRIAPEDILVAHDELDLPPGGIKLKFGGGLSGNGLKDVAAVLGTKDFWRLRIGIGHPRDLAASEQEVIDYVLHAPRADERKAIQEAIDKAMEVWPLIVAHDMQTAMLKLHTRARGEKREERGEEPPVD
jgi:PTH1 family peptidyl-tRNA hydrolase